MNSAQPDLFASPVVGPEDFAYAPDLLSREEEAALVTELDRLEFKPFEFRGFLGKRRVISFGWRYDFNHSKLTPAEDIPDFLLPLRAKAAAFAGRDPVRLEQLLINEYAPGAGIGWHRDRPEFEEVIAVSLLASGVLRLRRRRGTGFERVNVPVEPRSVYSLSGPARTEWEHSLPEVAARRISVTFRTLRARADRQGRASAALPQ